MDKPIYIGTSILDLSKSLMYDYYCNNLKSKYKDNVSLLYMDTDSFILEIKTSDAYEDMIDNIDIYDASNYKSGDVLFSSKNKRLLVSLKMNWVMSEFLGLRPKSYAFMYIDNNSHV